MSTFIGSTNCLGVQKVAAIIVCKSCRIGLPSDRSALSHLVDKHNIGRVIARTCASKAEAEKKELLNQSHHLRKEYESAPYPLDGEQAQTSGALPPLEGIEIINGFRCILCPACFSSERVAKKHFFDVHQHDEHNVERDWKQCLQNGSVLLQTLYGGNKTKYFPVSALNPIGEVTSVHLSPSVLHPTSDFPAPALAAAPHHSSTNEVGGLHESNEDVQHIFAEMDQLFSTTGSNSAPPRSLMNAFLARTNFDIFLQNDNISMSAAANYSGALGEYTDEERQVVKDVSQYLLNVPKLLPDIAPTVLHDVNLRGSKEFTTVSTKAAERYARSFARVVISALRMEHSPLLPTSVLPPLQQYAQSLRNPSPHQEASQDILHSLLMSICFHRLDKIDSPRSLFVHRFISFAMSIPTSRSQNDSFRYAQANDISPLLAALLYGTSSCAIKEIGNLAIQSKVLRDNSSIDQENENVSRARLNDRLEDIISSLEESQNSAASCIRKLLTIANTISKKEDVDFVFDMCISHPLCGIVNDVHISMSSLGNIVKALHADIRSSFSSVLYGASLPDEFFSHLATFGDNIQEKSPGFSFLNCGRLREKCRKYAVWLFNQITEARPTGKADFSICQSTPPSDVVQVFGKNLRRKAVQKWLSRVQEIQDKLLACTHLSSGSPGRATELETLQLFNTEHALRNFYVSQGRACIVTRYSKTRTLVGWDRIIPRFPDPKTSELFLTYLVLFRTLESIFLRSLYGVKVMKSHMEGLFVFRGTKYVACKIRDIIRSHFHSHSIPIQFNHFRHFAAGMVPSITQNSPDFLREQLTEEARQIAHLQAGHSVEVAEHSYARKSSDLPCLPATAFTKYRMFSTEWHRNMGLLPDSHPIHPLQSPYKSLEPTLPAPDLQVIAKSITDVISDNFKNHFNKIYSTLSGIKRSLPQSQAPPASQKRSLQTLRPPPNNDVERDVADLLPALRDLLKNPNALFTSKTQLQVAVQACEGREDLMVLMPTGSGKTIAILLPAFLEESHASTVIIVPVAALLHDHVEKCIRLGISVATWDNRYDDAQVYVISVNHTVDELRNFLNHLQNKGKLRRLVIDEAHLLLLWQHFRSSIQRIPHALKSRGTYTQVILLTATLPPRYRERLVHLLSLNSVVLHSHPSVRHNLRFSVIDTSSYNKTEKFVNYRQAMRHALCEQVLNLSKSTLPQGGRILIFSMYKHETDDLRAVVETFLHKKLDQRVPVIAYHAGKTPRELKKAYDAWKDNHPKLIVAVGTEAFGTGLDVPNVRGVFHFGGSNGIIQYVQETGRAGRDSKPAVCTIIYNKRYAQNHTQTVMKPQNQDSFFSNDEKEDQKHEWLMMCNYMTQTTLCRKNQLFAHIDETAPGMCIFDDTSINCDVCEKHHQLSTIDERILATQPSSLLPSHQPPHFTPSQPTPPQPTPSFSNQNPFRITAHPPSSFQLSQYGNTQSISSGQRLSSPNGPNPVRRRLSFGRSQENRETMTGQDIINKFRLKCHGFEDTCIPCLVYDGNQNLSDHKCRHLKNRCKRCFKTGHQRSECPSFDPRRHNFCYRCSLSQIMGENVHKAHEFGGKCFMGLARDICWAFWTRDHISQETIASSLFSTNELSLFQTLFDNSSDEERLAENKTKFYDEWLQRTRDGVPNLVNIFLWWCDVIHNA